MCCKRRANKQASTMAKLVQEPPTTSLSVAHDEPLGPPPAYEHVKNESKNITSNMEIHATKSFDDQGLPSIRATPEYMTIDTNLDSSSNNTKIDAVRPTCQSRCAAKREHKREQKQLKRGYRQEKRELRAEHRAERKEVRRARCGPIGLLVRGVSNLMK